MTAPGLPAGRTYVGAYALCRQEETILLVRISSSFPDAGLWTLPGGGVEFGEDPDAAVLRELSEETGLTGRITGLAGVYSKVIGRSALPPHGAVHHLGIIFDVDVDDADLCAEIDGSTDLCQWVGLEEISSYPLVPLVEFGLGLIGGD